MDVTMPPYAGQVLLEGLGCQVATPPKGWQQRPTGPIRLRRPAFSHCHIR